MTIAKLRFVLGRPSFFLLTLLIFGCVLVIPGIRADVGSLEDQISSQDVVHADAVLSMTALEPGDTVDAAVEATIDQGWHINSHRPHEDWLIPAKVSFDTLDGLTPEAIDYPEGQDVFLAGSNMSVYEGRVVFPFKVAAASDLAPGDYVLPVRLNYQPCNDRMCGPPATIAMELPVTVGPGGQPANDELFASALTTGGQPPASGGAAAPASTPLPQAQSDLQRLISEYGVWGYVLALGLAFLTGLLLSFSPCTYPMIPITVSIFGGQQRTVGRGFVLSLFYVGSMAIVYGIMGLVVSLVGGVFGAWLASPPVVITIAVVFIIFSLSMFGLYELNVPMAIRQKLGTRKTGGGVVGAIVLGIIAALVVSPCVGPFVAGILLYVATSGSPVLGFLVLFIFALGLGTLYVLIGTFSTAINKLPGSGAWMETVKKFFGFVLLLMALYFLRTIVSATLIAVLTGLLLLALGVFGGGLDRLTSESSFFDRLRKFVGILALIFSAYFLVGTILTEGVLLPPIKEWLPAVSGAGTQAELIPWEHNLENGLARARQEGKPVLIDTWATWCANCRLMDRETYGNSEVAASAKRFVPIKVQLETAGSPESKAFMKQFGLKSYTLPTTLLLSSKGEVVSVLQGYIKPKEMVDYLAKIN